MSTEENKAVVRRAYEEFNTQNWAGIEELYAPDYVWHGTGVVPDMDLAGLKAMCTAGWTAFPDQHYTVEDLIAKGDKVVCRFTCRGTHQGVFIGMPPTGKVVTYTGIHISRVAGGKCVEDWRSADVLGFLQQLGAIPQRAQAGA